MTDPEGGGASSLSPFLIPGVAMIASYFGVEFLF